MANELTHKHFFNSPAVKQKFSEVLDGNGQQFVASLLSIVTNNNLLAKATNESIMTAAMKAATLKLPIEPSLGMAYIVPYNRNEKQGNTWVKINEAQFQMGYKGFIQLAQRSGQIRNINCDIVYKEEFLRYDKVYGTLHLKEEQVDSGEVEGYFASLELINGFRKMIFWKKEKVIAHAQKYSKTYDKQIGDFKSGTPWKTEFDAMAQKTLIKELLSKYAPLSTELQEAIIADNEDSNVNEVKRAKDVTPPESDNLSDLLGAPEETGKVIDQEPENGQMDMLEGEDF
ncbi:recombinase RecT [uncultured Streptococcus sp.]|jgi:recombinase, phage recT family|uniref:recombinase RecT n=1 Tax=uncultured Streptococcus sp. TaxID=83427 RepID=UPI00205ED644|nr:recombinase RecT [uncultured Streptococcus sp.]DAX37243.1 MAG TPA: RecT protein [Caudoviricetes sp.]